MKKLLTESGIRIPKGTHAAKVIYHADLDGVMSALLTVKQLEKQGIAKDKIKLSSIQYGANNNAVKKKLSASKGQMVALVDFARLPTGKDAEGVRKPDFWSDHHEQSKDNSPDPKSKYVKKVKPKKDSKTPRAPIGSIMKQARTGDYKVKVGEKELTHLSKIQTISNPDFTKEIFKQRFEKEIDKMGEDPKEWTGVSLFIGRVIKNWKGAKDNVGDIMSAIRTAPIDPKGKKSILGYLRQFMPKKKKIEEAIGKTEFPSETEHLAKVHAQNFMTGKDIAEISKMDSASYTNLADVMDLKKDFRQKGRMERLAILTNVVLSDLLRKNPNAINTLIKTANPSLVSVYNTVLKLGKLSSKQANMIKEISKENPDWKKIDALRTSLPKEMAPDVAKGKKIREPITTKEMKDRAKKDIKQSTDPKTTKFSKGSDYVIIQSTKGRGQPSRFMGSLMTKQSGEVFPANMREWGTMFQISLNPQLKLTDDQKINLADGVDRVIDSVIRDVNSGKIKVRDKDLTRWGLTKVIKPESGGHAGIATVTGLNTLGLAPTEDREEFKKLIKLEKRVKALKSKKKMKAVMPETAKRIKELKKIKAEYAEEKFMIIKELKKRIIDGVSKSMKRKGVIAPKGEERFKVKKKKNNIKEQIQWKTKYF